MKTAEDVMTRHVVNIEAEATVAEAIDKMRQANVSSLLVRRDDHLETWGFMSVTDIVEKVVAQGLEPADVRVSEIMSKPLITVSPRHSLQECAALLSRANIRQVPVYDGKDIVGIVNIDDIFHAL